MNKITEKHLERSAYVYIRQSTLQQVRNNQESYRRQYALQDRARELGFKTVVVLDEDLGISGAGNQDRPGFSRLLIAVCNGEVGGVFALEASRLARNNRDWHHLIDLCVLTETIVVDAEGIYEPRLLNDRLLLGLKGTMSEFELGLLRQRAQEAYRQKVLRGDVLTRVPIGYVRKGENGIEMTPDREIQEAIRCLFRQLEGMSSLRQVLLWYHHEKILFPAIRTQGGGQTLCWTLPDYQQLRRVITSPVYAGAFAWGRTACRLRMVDGRSRKTGGHRVTMDEWQVLLKDHHEAYISWDRFMENQQTLKSNRTKSHAVSCGAARKGAALLSGLFRCARCGNKLQVNYRGPVGRTHRYHCLTGTREQGKPVCLSFSGTKVERAVVDLVLEACQPLGVDASLQVIEGSQSEQEHKRKALELALERARFEADRARRQYDAVDPGNRLVAAELEARWNAALAQVAETESRLQAEQEVRAPLSEEQRHRLMTLGADLQALWNDPAAPVELKKRIIRTVINEIVVDVDHESSYVEMNIHWAGGLHTPLRVRRNQSGQNTNATDKNIIELVRELAKGWNDAYIAGMLNRLGFFTGKENSWNETRVKNLRIYHKIPVFSKSEMRPWMTMTEVARDLDVNIRTVRIMLDRGVLPGRQITKGAPWMIERENLRLPEVESFIKAVRAGRSAPLAYDNQLLMPSL